MAGAVVLLSSNELVLINISAVHQALLVLQVGKPSRHIISHPGRPILVPSSKMSFSFWTE